ncbi:hypothetical protein [Protofrankia coriariae]|uniref:hypothetical protein n=1 Tax=Protofrankia coriariae TaxID=1562887 RepID=UPI001F169DC2|nr:hypothetical protein [Protofrankia coriariae]
MIGTALTSVLLATGLASRGVVAAGGGLPTVTGAAAAADRIADVCQLTLFVSAGLTAAALVVAALTLPRGRAAQATGAGAAPRDGSRRTAAGSRRRGFLASARREVRTAASSRRAGGGLGVATGARPDLSTEAPASGTGHQDKESP